MITYTSPEQPISFEKPSLFLAGAITGAADWQTEAVKLLDSAFATCFNPRRQDGFASPDHPEYLSRYEEQVEWEHRYLLAADVVLFWLPKEAQAITTRFELGWLFGMRFGADPATRPLAVGIEPGVTGDTYYRIVLPKFDIPVHTTLEATCARACELVKR